MHDGEKIGVIRYTPLLRWVLGIVAGLITIAVASTITALWSMNQQLATLTTKVESLESSMTRIENHVFLVPQRIGNND